MSDLKERAAPVFHITAPESQVIQGLQMDIRKLKAEKAILREWLRGLCGRGASLEIMEEAEKILEGTK